MGKIFLKIVRYLQCKHTNQLRKYVTKLSTSFEGHSHNYSEKNCQFYLLDHYVVICNTVDNCTKIGIALMARFLKLYALACVRSWHVLFCVYLSSL